MLVWQPVAVAAQAQQMTWTVDGKTRHLSWQEHILPASSDHPADARPGKFKALCLTWVFSARGWNPQRCSTEARTRSGVHTGM